MITIRNLHKAFSAQLRPLRGVDLDVADGTTLTVLGRSGSGKSVLLKSIVGLLEPDRGSIRVDDDEVVGADRALLLKIRRKVGYVFQNGALYDSLTVGENLSFPLEKVLKLGRDEIRERVHEYLGHVGLLDKINKMPSELSGGQRKRVGVARTIITEPRYLLYDEPTTGLDPQTAKDIAKLVVQLQEELKITSIVVTHDPYCLNIVADRVAFIDDGKVVFNGTKEESKESDIEFLREFFTAEVIS
ncbi:MAG TPA: ATP-binding cassette domain-containing protein [Candidatus Kapabacteria bacterium]|jgi:phospholipid/cholesterol/gamma-HCH transport system ATP-binding protein|nr:ATP-binding cassette domain-containing protein [Candidatus Kapabacteria bacterium]